MNFSGTEKFKYNACILNEKMSDGGMIFYNNKTKETSILNQTGTVVFEYCQKMEYKEVKELFINKYSNEELNSDNLGSDLDEIINVLIKKDIIYVL